MPTKPSEKAGEPAYDAHHEQPLHAGGSGSTQELEKTFPASFVLRKKAAETRLMPEPASAWALGSRQG